MLLAPYQSPNFGHARQVRSVQAADRAAPNDADSLHALASGSRSTFTRSAARLISPLSARNKLSGLLKESSIKTPFSNNASCRAAEIVWIGAAPPSPMPFAPL